MNEPHDSGGNVAEFSVSELSRALKRAIEDGFPYVRVRGELGRISRPGSGHVYLDLKDDKAVLSGVIWKGVAAGLRIEPEQGMEVVVTGRITTYPGQSRYQIVIESMEPAGLGALMVLLEERKKKLAAEGLFDDARKQPLPYLPITIGVVTSPTGAVIRDILHRLADRFPVHVLVWPVRVQGEGSAEEVAGGIDGFNLLEAGGAIPRPDLLIVARGGGSVEDLWSFNEEIVVRAAAASEIPLISAVGHETDWCLLDLASDRRAPTPTAAAEFAVPERAELIATVRDYARRQMQAVRRVIETARASLKSAARALPRPDEILALPRQRLDAATARLPRALGAGIQLRRNRLHALSGRFAGVGVGHRLRATQDRLGSFEARARRALRRRNEISRAQFERETARLARAGIGPRIRIARERLDTLRDRARRALMRRIETARTKVEAQAKLLRSVSYQGVLARGFALVRDGDGRPVRSAAEAKPGLAVAIEFHDGRADARIEGAPGLSRKAVSGKRPPPVKGQGDLF